MKKMFLILYFILIIFFINAGESNQGEVKLNLDQYMKIMKDLWDKDKGLEPKASPVSYIVKSSSYNGSVNDLTINLKAVYKLTLLKDEWVSIPVLDIKAGIKKSLLDGNEVGFVIENGMYNLILNKKGDHILEIEFSAQMPNGNINFKVMQSPINNVSILTARSKANILIKNAKSSSVIKDVNIIITKASIGFTDELDISIVKLVEEKENGHPVINGEVNTLVSVGEGVIHCISDVNLFIREAKVSKIRIIIPDDISIINVFGDNVINYSTEEKGNQKRLCIEYNLPVNGESSLHIEYEKNLGSTSGSYDLPVILLENAARQKGYIGVQAVTNVEIKTGNTESITGIDIKELPRTIWERAEMPLLLAYKYMDKGSIILDVKRHADIPLLSSVCDKASYFTVITEEGNAMTRAVFDMRNTYDQFMKLRLPEDSTVLSSELSGKPVKPSISEDGYILLPLEKSGIDEEDLKNFKIVVIYKTDYTKFGKFGRIKNFLCETKFQIQRIEQDLWLPVNYRYLVSNNTTLNYGISSYNIEGNINNIKSVDQDDVLKDSEDFKKNEKMDKTQTFNFLNQKESRVYDEDQSNNLVKGRLPVKINIPSTGILLQFSKTLPKKGDLEFIDLKYIPPVLFTIYRSFKNIILLSFLLYIFLFCLYILIGIFKNYKKLNKIYYVVCILLIIASIFLSFFVEQNFIFTGFFGILFTAFTLMILYELFIYMINKKNLLINKDSLINYIFLFSLGVLIILQVFAERFDLGGKYFCEFLIVFNIIIYFFVGAVFLIVFIRKIIKKKISILINK